MNKNITNILVIPKILDDLYTGLEKLKIGQKFKKNIQRDLLKDLKNNTMRSTPKSTRKEKVSRNKKAKLNHEWRRIDYFFEIFSEEGGAEELWKMLKLALTSDNESNDAKNRSNMLFFYEYTKELFENIFTLLQKQKHKRGSTAHAAFR